MLIGLTGRAGAGKDTVADILVAHYGFTKYSFAGPLKQALAVVGIVEPADRALKEMPIPGKDYSYRKAAQTLGTEWARNLDTDFWVNLADAKVGEGRFVISDVRFENEVSWVRRRLGSVWHLTGRGVKLAEGQATHVSEMPLPIKVGDFIVYNQGTLKELESDVSDYLLRLGIMK